MADNVFLPYSIGAPPILPDIQRQLHDYIAFPENLLLNDVEKLQQYWGREANPASLLFYELSDDPTSLCMNRDPTDGKLLGISEIANDKSSLDGNEISVTHISAELESVEDVDIGLCDLLTKPDSFARGYNFIGEEDTLEIGPSEIKKIPPEESNKSHFVDLAQLLKNQEDITHLLESTSITEHEENDTLSLLIPDENSAVLETVSKDAVFNPPVICICSAAPVSGIKCTEWAEMLDVSQKITDFHQRVPFPAKQYNFELDTFQQQAILKLEEHCNVLVSAHTSAGKTVVAEYAIALSQRHQTRTIYTSPIKALSNQKYREFRNAFNDVGLLTGDFQVNPKGACLVVTTEILRSMLLAQNDVIRDLEFVIFDEVHYINDMDRGHVWEETVILLPPHVSIVMLSATIPNALQFADWVGRTKQRRMYVVSTLFRPVPLKHYLYTGSGGSTKNERFILMDGTSFKRSGHVAAVQAKQKRQTKLNTGPRDKRRLNPKQESTMWVALLEHLLANDELPVVAFTLSRKRCDLNAEALSLDLTNAKEKSHIRHFFNQSVMRLNQSDRQLPQILQLSKLLERGIGVHHSGILPILKEIVELLFQERCVKVLFATETFAMGVNMPAKTVVFDSIYKYDGLSERLLLPSEYIQMAGRAGRRGLDKNGNVLILCKGDVPPEDELLSMMTGNPKMIESQFRLTYSIILKLERKRVAAEGKVTVEEMMANSFMEVEHVKKKTNHELQLLRVNQALTEANVTTVRGDAWEKLQEVSRLGLQFLDLWHEISPKVFASKTALKVMTPGRVLSVTHGNHVNKLGVLLSIENRKALRFRILVLNEENDEPVEDVTGFHKLVALTSTTVFLPNTLRGHLVLYVDPWDVLEVTTEAIKIEPNIILHDWDNRQIPRFKDNPPGQSFQRLLEELVAVTHRVQMSGSLEAIPMLREMVVTSEDELIAIQEISDLKKKLQKTTLSDIVDWQPQLEQVFRLRCLEKERDNLSYLLSYKSMSLYADYQSRLLALRKLDYVDSRNSVMLKGNVACEMSNHELLITELVLRNALDPLNPAEIAALLSCFVYKGKDSGLAPAATQPVIDGIVIIKEIEEEITLIEMQCGVQASDPFTQEKNLNFDLVPVVYEWAIQKPFSDIMMLTDIQEGVIVRCIQQLCETIKDVRDAARIVGDPTLQQKMEEASNAIKRDIVFAASLYMQ